MFKIFSTATIATALLACPVVHADTMLGAYVQGDGWTLSEIDGWNTAANKPMAITNLFSNFDYNWGNLKYQANNIVSRGAVPMITWMPVISARPKANLLTEIVNGQWDAYINGWINGFKKWRSAVPAGRQSRIMLRFGHEFNGIWYPWSNDPQNFKAAWHYIHDKFELAKINPYIDWVWCANNTDVDNVKDITQYYPGDLYVDWTSLDGYNFGSNYSWSTWKSFDQTFSAPYNKLVDNYPTKPIIIAEVGVTEPTDLPNPTYGQDGNDWDNTESKEVWVADMFTRIVQSYPAIRAVTWFNINKELNWALHKPNNTGLQAYKVTTQSPHYLSTFKNITK